MPKNKQKTSAKNPRMEAAKLADVLVRAEHISKRQLYGQNFARGVFFGLGSALGATVIIALLLWLLSFFETVPLLGRLIESTRESIQQ